jgi:hypothetical protein
MKPAASAATLAELGELGINPKPVSASATANLQTGTPSNEHHRQAAHDWIPQPV